MSEAAEPAKDVIVAELVEPPAAPQPTPWGFWPTVGFSIAVLVAFMAIETAITIAFMLAQLPKTPIAGDFVCSGLLLSVATWVAAPLCLAFVVLLARLRNQLSVREYLSLHGVSAGRFLAWAAILLAFVAVADGTTWLLDISVVPSFMVKAYRTAGSVPLLLATLWIAAPVFEEVFFRGFMFHGIQQSRLGNVGAILITSVVWSAIHMQYNVYEVSIIFLGGILLGIARARSNSVFLTIGLHSIMNMVATIELWVYLANHPAP